MNNQYSILTNSRLSEDRSIVAVFQQNSSHKNGNVFLIIESIDEHGKYKLKRFDYLTKRSGEMVASKKEVIADGSDNAKKELLKMVGNASLISKGIELMDEDVETLEMLMSQDHDTGGKLLSSYSPEAEIVGVSHHKIKEYPLLKNNYFLKIADLLYMLAEKNKEEYLKKYIYTLIESDQFYSLRELAQFKDRTFENDKVNNQFLQFEKSIKNFTTTSHNFDVEQKRILAEHLMKLNKILKDEHKNNPHNPVVPFLLESFYDFTRDELCSVQSKDVLLQRTDLLCKRLDEKSAEFELHNPVNHRLKSIICAVVGAIIGFAIGAVVGAIATTYWYGVGSLPGGFLGAAKGFAIGAAIGLSAGGITGYFGSFFSSKKSLYDSPIALIEKCKNEISSLKNVQRTKESIRHNKFIEETQKSEDGPKQIVSSEQPCDNFHFARKDNDLLSRIKRRKEIQKLHESKVHAKDWKSNVSQSTPEDNLSMQNVVHKTLGK